MKRSVWAAGATSAGGRILLACALTAVAALPAAAAREWPTFRGDNARSGRGDAPLSDEPAVVWSCELGGSVDGSPIVVGSRVYVGTSRGVFGCVASDTGRLLWTIRLDGAVCSAAAASGDRLVVGTSRGLLYCISTDGRLLWRMHCWDAIVASPLIIGDRCFWGTMDGVFHAVALSDGRRLWSRKLAGGVSGAAASDGDRIYVADEGGSAWALAPADGSVLWQRKTGCPAMAAPVLHGDAVIVPLVSPTRLAPPSVPFLQVLSADTGELRWSVVKARSIFASPLVGPRGLVYVSVEGYLSATVVRCQTFDGRREVFKRPVGGVVDSSPAMAGSRAYFGAQDGCLYTVDVASGRVISRVRLAQKIYSSPALVGGRLFIGASDGRLYCLK